MNSSGQQYGEVEKFEQHVLTERKPKAGFSDWQAMARRLGHRGLTRSLELLDPGDRSGVNNHTVIAERLKKLGLPVQTYTTPTLEVFLDNPLEHLRVFQTGEYYFVSIRPGLHIAHAKTEAEVVEFVRNAQLQHPEICGQKEMYVSKNGEAIMSGHIIVQSDDSMTNTVYAEFTNSEFNQFHRGFTTPEISVKRGSSGRFEWTFRGPLASDEWRTDELFRCHTGVRLSRKQMAEKIHDALLRIPHDERYFMPGYYEVLIERTPHGTTKPVYIEAIPGGEA